MRFVKLNAFQRIMRLWDAVHPYNAVQAFRMDVAPGATRIEDAWRATLSGLGLGRVIVRGNEYAHFAPSPDDARADVYLAPAGTSLDAFLSEQLNLRFPGDDVCPFRAFVVQQPDGSLVIGVTYHHWVADSVSIRWLLHEWFLQLKDPDGSRAREMRVAEKGLFRTFGPDVCKWRLDDAVLDMLRYRTRFARARRVDRPMGDCGVALSLHHVPDGVVSLIARHASEAGVTVNDALLSVISQTVDRSGASPPSRGRDELAVGTVVDLRAMSGMPLSGLFGLFLGFTTTLMRPADLESFPRLLRTVARQNAWHKRTRAAQSSVLRLGIGIAESAVVSPRRWAELYRDRMPIAAGISNVNMNRAWAGEHHPSPVLDYYRVAPTGPMIPLLFTFTTLGDKLHFLMTRQTALIDDGRRDVIARSITRRLEQLAGNPLEWVNL
jgi:hypothetical protein